MYRWVPIVFSVCVKLSFVIICLYLPSSVSATIASSCAARRALHSMWLSGPANSRHVQSEHITRSTDICQNMSLDPPTYVGQHPIFHTSLCKMWLVSHCRGQIGLAEAIGHIVVELLRESADEIYQWKLANNLKQSHENSDP